jgi:hypothetical protein
MWGYASGTTYFAYPIYLSGGRKSPKCDYPNSIPITFPRLLFAMEAIRIPNEEDRSVIASPAARRWSGPAVTLGHDSSYVFE